METRTKFQPLVIIVKPEHALLDEDREKDAFAGLIQRLFICNSLSFRHLEGLRDWIKLNNQKRDVFSNVIALIIEENLDYDYDLISEILLIRKESLEIKNIPTIVLSWKRITKYPFIGGRNFRNGHIEIYDDLSSELVKLIHHLSAEWVASKDRLGLDYAERIPNVISLLEEVYKQNQEEEGVNYSSPVDHNHMVVTEALRLGIYNGELIKEKCDKIQKEEKFKLGLDNISLQKDLEKIREMDDEQKSEFFSNMTRTIQSIGGCGPNILGFAIDPKTLEHITVGYGRHNYVCMLLRQHLDRMHLLNKGIDQNFPDNTTQESDFFTGTIFRRVAGIENSVLKIWGIEEELREEKRKKDYGKIVSFLKTQKKFIIIDQKYQLL